MEPYDVPAQTSAMMVEDVQSILRRKGVKMLRIDHSDVHLENDRLTEDLSYSLDSIHRSYYRQLLNRQDEISQLRKLCCVLPQNNKAGQTEVSTSGRARKTGVDQSLQSPRALQQTPVSSGDQLKPGTPASSGPLNKKATWRPFSAVTPRANTWLDSPDTTKNRPDTSADQNRDKTNQLDSTDGLESSKLLCEGQARRGRSASDKSRRRVKSANNVTEVRNYKLEALMAKLKAKTYPTEWYTTVVPAADVTVKRFRDRAESAISRSCNSRPKSRRPHTATGIPEENYSNQKPTSAKQRSISPTPLKVIDESPDLPKPLPEGLPTPSVIMDALSEQPTGSKTRRQLKEISEQNGVLAYEQIAQSILQWKRDVNRERNRLLQIRVDEFVRSLRELQKERERANAKKDILDQLRECSSFPWFMKS